MSVFGANNPQLPSHNFRVYVGLMPISFAKVSNLEICIETETLIEGGQNQYAHSILAPHHEEKTLVFERGVVIGFRNLVVGLSVGTRFKDIIIMVHDNAGIPRKVYLATGLILKKRSFSDLDAMSNQVFIETLEFIYQGLTEVPAVEFLTNFFKAPVTQFTKTPPKSTQEQLADKHEATRPLNLFAKDYTKKK